MTSYFVSQNNKGIECKKIENGEKSYINNEYDFIHLLNEILSTKYLLKVKNNDLILETPDKKYIFKNNVELFRNPIFNKLKLQIRDESYLHGYVDISEVKKINRQPKRKNKGKTIRNVILFGLAGGAAINLIAGFLKDKKDDSNETNKPSITTELPVHEDPVNIDTDENDNKIENDEPMDSDNSLDYNNGYDIDNLITSPYGGIEQEDDNISYANVEFDDLSKSEKAINTKNTYFELIEKYSKLYGLDGNLVLGIATQERGTHASKIDSGGGVGLMQIQYDVWINKSITAYKLNGETGKFEETTIQITDDKIRNLESNIEISCMILQESLIRSKYNIPIAIQMYNMGCGTIDNIITNYSSTTGKSKEQILNDPSDLGWLDYRYGYMGDPNYLENVNKWIDYNDFTVTNVFNNEDVRVEFYNSNEPIEKVKKL